MTIENTLERIAIAVEKLAGTALIPDLSEPATPTVTPPAQQATPTPAPVQAAVPSGTITQGAPAPILKQPTVTPSYELDSTIDGANTVDPTFSTPQEMVAYVMEAYTQLGASKGADIQKVLQTLGYSNINDVIPDHYAQLKAGIEALKVG